MLSPILAALLMTSVQTPSGFHFGEGQDSHDFDAMCSSHTARELDAGEMPLAENSLIQVDCHGFDYFGAERLAEFVFADGSLTHVWVLVEEGELDALQAEFEALHGQPDRVAPVFAAFFEARAAVRRDIPEALYYGENAAPLFEGFFNQ